MSNQNGITEKLSAIGRILPAVLLILALGSCQDPFELNTVLGLDLAKLTVSPASPTISSGNTQTLTVSGGTAPFTWEVYSGPGTMSGGTTATEVYDPGGLSGLATVKVTDAEGFFGVSEIRVTDIDPLLLLTGTLKLYPGESTTIYASGGDGSYDFTIDTDSSGIAVFTPGATSAAYTAGSTPGIDVLRVTDGLSATRTVTIEVMDPGSSIPDIDYSIVTVNAAQPTQLGGGITADFTHRNGGSVGGSGIIQWTAYVSTTPGMAGIVSQADSGTVTALGAGQTLAAPQAIGGSWPDSPGTYHIVVHLSAEADVDTLNNSGASSPVSNTVDYTLSAEPAGSGETAGTAMNLEFRFVNSGSVDDTSPVSWAAYRSSDMSIGSGDVQLASGSFGGLQRSDLEEQIVPVTGTWPTDPGTWYIIMTWDSPNDGNELDATPPAFAVSVPDIDYGTGSSGIIPAGGLVSIGDITSETFRIENFGTDDGSEAVEWTAWLSADTTPGTIGDIEVDSGTHAALNSGVESLDITVGVNWTAVEGDYYLIVALDAPDDVNPANDNIVSTDVYQLRYSDVDYEILTAATDSPGGGGSPVIGSSLSDTFEVTNTGLENGVSDLTWSAWISTDTAVNVGDVQIDSGTIIGGLDSGVGSGPITFTGTWPETVGTYYLLVTWSAADDNDDTNDLVASLSTSSVRLPVNDYGINAVSAPSGTIAGETASGSFTVQNYGGDDDPGEGIWWTVYASTDTVFGAGDAEIASGYRAAMTVAEGSDSVSWVGTWPESGADYYTIVVIESLYDPAAANDENYDLTGPTPVENQTDYQITSVDYHPLGSPGTALTTAPLPPAHPSYIPYEFRITEIGGAISNKKIDYTVYASMDPILDITDYEIKDSSIPAADVIAGGGIVDEAFDDGNIWPAFPSEYYLIVSINCGDDINASNDIYVAGPVEVAVQVPDVEPNDDFGPFTTAPPNLPSVYTNLTPYLPTGALRADEMVRIDGEMEAYNVWDTVGFVVGADMTKIEIEAEWATGYDDVDIYLWDQDGAEIPTWLTADTTDDYEDLTVINLTPGETLYVGVWFYMDNDRGTASYPEDYTLTIKGSQ